MSKTFATTLSIVLLVIPAFSQIVEKVEPPYISTIQFRGATDLSQLPVIRLGGQLQLSFDALNGEEEDYYYTITHHNFDWTERVKRIFFK